MKTGVFFLCAVVFLIFSVLVCGCAETVIENPSSLEAGWTVIRPPSDVESLVIYGDLVAAGGKDGVYLIDRENASLVGQPDLGFDVSYVSSLLADKKGNLWIGFNKGLIRYSNEESVLYTADNGLSDNRVNALLEDSSGRILVGTWDGVSVFENGSWSYIDSVDGLSDDMVNVIYEDKNGGLWFGSYVAPRGGLSYCKDGQWQYFTASGVLPHNNINAVAEDGEGRIWVGTGLYDRGGAVRLVDDGTAWSSDLRVLKADGLAGEKVRSLYYDEEGNIWFGSEYDGIAVDKGGLFEIISKDDGLSDNEVKCMISDSDGNMWIGTHDGVTVISSSALVNI